MCPGPRLKRTFTLLKATLNRVQVLFSIRGTKRLAPFPARMRFWRDTTAKRRTALCRQAMVLAQVPSLAQDDGESTTHHDRCWLQCWLSVTSHKSLIPVQLNLRGRSGSARNSLDSQ